MARFDLSDGEWALIKPLLPNKPRGVARVNDRRGLNAALSTAFVWPVSGSPIRRLHEVDAT